MAKIKMILTPLFCFLIRSYQIFLSRFFLPTCRFQPTCSFYAIEALQKKGLLFGTYLTFKRLCRCHPLSLGGFDPVEPNEEKKTWI